MNKEHGDYHLEWQGDLLILSLSGSFNEIAITRFFQQVMGSFQSRSDRPWVLLSSLDKEMIGTPAVLEIIKTAYRWGEQHQCKAAAISGANIVINQLYLSFFEELSYPARIFEKKDDAVNWLSEQL